MSKKVIIDCDTGTDDAIALICGLLSKALEICAITTVSGNVELKYTAKNTLDLVRYLGHGTLVAVGAPKPIFRELDSLRTTSTHGKSGLGDVDLPSSNAGFSADNAVLTIRNEALASNLELITIGPLTNIAHAIMAFPELKSRIKRITFMGGSISRGNVTEVAEFNFCADPEAAKIVLSSGIPLTMVGLDVTEKVVLNNEDYLAIKEINSKEATIVSRLLKFMFKRADNGGEGAVMHDALAVASVSLAGVIKTRRYFVDVEICGEYTCGYSFVDKNKITNNKPNVEVAVDVDIQMFKDWMYSTLLQSASH